MVQSPHRLILASGSPRRRALLTELGYTYEVILPEVDERVTGAPDVRVRVLAIRKASDVAERVSEGWIIGADTLVSLDGKTLGKPSDADDAFRMLMALSGREHDVFTGVCLLDAATGRMSTHVARTGVVFRPLSESEVRDYIATGEPMDKAGAYAIQGGARGFVTAYQGAYENIVGFPTQAFQHMYQAFSAAM